MMHELKILPEYFRAQATGVKTFEIRKNDRNFKVGDDLWLREYDSKSKKYTGNGLLDDLAYDVKTKADYNFHVILSALRQGVFWSTLSELDEKDQAKQCEADEGWT
ncbi:DUF3850 domain-containing protein [Lactobacillus johnsonii]|uniref:DUF3850 domain-containing protein n=1 Tax=Lactobacillus johnsonii TaxID=33959 RepID=A0AAW5M382_LACJH|nr:DUF3850 domain-containing protein [Lactobacillus johnsonii]MCR1915449.1 DUF3850 domain-containing protein [Lactobacillus johnsonii]